MHEIKEKTAIFFLVFCVVYLSHQDLGEKYQELKDELAESQAIRGPLHHPQPQQRHESLPGY